MDPASLQKEDFDNHVGTVFKVTSGDVVVELTLDEVTDYSDDGSKVQGLEGRPPFAISLSGPKDVLLLDAIHQISHPEMGDLQLFMKPYEETAEVVHYEVLFN